MSRVSGVTLFTTTILAAGWLAGVAHAAEASGAEAGEVEGVVVQGERVSTSAVAGLGLTLRETPQSVTVVPRDQIDDFALTTANELLAQIPGINVEKVETDRTYYNARGFDITNFQVDGVGMPLIWGIQFGDLDTAIYERVEAVRGANAMMTGTGNPSATINYIRKRPTQETRGAITAQLGSWDDKRLEADVSGPLNAAATVTGRLVYANEDKGSYLDHYGVNRNVYYGVLSWDITPKLNLTGGYSLQDNRARGVLWGALPLTYSDGTRISYPVSASTSADWTSWNVRDQTAFGELSYSFDNGWRIKGVGTYRRSEEQAKLLYAYGHPDAATGIGVIGMTGVYPSTHRQYMADLYASGPVSLGGRTHELVVGVNASQAYATEYEGFAATVPTYPAVSDWSTAQIAEPDYPSPSLTADQSDRMYRAYAAAHLNLSDRLKAVVGFNALKLTSKGYSYGVDTSREESAVSPYAGLVYDLTSRLSAYASYTDIFNPQSEVDVDHRKLAAAHGESFEAGLKSEWLEGRLYATAAVFQSRQLGLADYAGSFADGKSYYSGVDTTVSGYELEASGAINDRWAVAGGWTQLSFEKHDGAEVRPYLPRKTFKLSTTYRVPELRDLKVGAALRWQDDVHIQDISVVTQKAYAVLDLMASVRVADQVRATVNLKNVGDTKYLTSLMWSQSYYAAPRSVSLSLNYSF